MAEPILYCKVISLQLNEFNFFKKTIEGKRRREQQRMRWLDNIIDSMDMNLKKIVEDAGA